MARNKYLRELLSAGIFLFGIFGILASGGGGGGGGGGGSSTVSISNLDYSPEGAFLNDGGGSVIVNGSIDFSAPGGNVASYVLTVFDSSLNIVSTLSDPIPGVGGIESGSLFVSLVINTTVADDFSVEVYLIDTSNNNSNTLAGTFQILAPLQTASNIPDTGVDKCYNQVNIINCPISESDPFYGQDYQYSSNPMNFTNNGDGTVTDNVTTLMWQMDDDGTDYNWYEATGTFDAVDNPTTTNVCGDLTFAGYTDWRLPFKNELMSIVDYGTANPAINTTYFPSTSNIGYWSATENPFKWRVDFASGSAYETNGTFIYHVRCVRGAVWGNSIYVDNGNGTVSDTVTGLIWQKAGYDSNRNWQDMLTYCENLDLAGNTDWRFPDIKELESIVNAKSYLSNVSNDYCSSTTVANENNKAWKIVTEQSSTAYGQVSKSVSKSSCSRYLRCVR